MSSISSSNENQVDILVSSKLHNVRTGILYCWGTGLDWTGLDWTSKTWTSKTRTSKSRTSKTRTGKTRTGKTQQNIPLYLNDNLSFKELFK